MPALLPDESGNRRRPGAHHDVPPTARAMAREGGPAARSRENGGTACPLAATHLRPPRRPAPPGTHPVPPARFWVHGGALAGGRGSTRGWGAGEAPCPLVPANHRARQRTDRRRPRAPHTPRATIPAPMFAVVARDQRRRSPQRAREEAPEEVPDTSTWRPPVHGSSTAPGARHAPRDDTGAHVCSCRWRSAAAKSAKGP